MSRMNAKERAAEEERLRKIAEEKKAREEEEARLKAEEEERKRKEEEEKKAAAAKDKKGKGKKGKEEEVEEPVEETEEMKIEKEKAETNAKLEKDRILIKQYEDRIALGETQKALLEDMMLWVLPSNSLPPNLMHKDYPRLLCKYQGFEKSYHLLLMDYNSEI